MGAKRPDGVKDQVFTVLSAFCKFFRNDSVQNASGGPVGGQTFEKFDKQILRHHVDAPPKLAHPCFDMFFAARRAESFEAIR